MRLSAIVQAPGRTDLGWGWPHTSGDAALTAWSIDPLPVVGVALAGTLYAVGLRRSRRASLAQPGRPARRIPRSLAWWRAVCFYVGLAAILLALEGPLDHLAAELFTFHMVQHLLLTSVAAPLLLLGAPLYAALRGLPRQARSRAIGSLVPLVHRAGLSWLVAAVSHPLVAWSFYLGTLSFWHIPYFYDLALRVEWVHILEHTTFLASALLFWNQVIDPLPFRCRLSYPSRLAYVFVASIHGPVIGGLLAFAPDVVYRSYREPAEPALRLWNLSPLADQQLSAVILWVPGGFVYLLAILLLFAAWLQQEEQPRRRDELRPDGAA